VLGQLKLIAEPWDLGADGYRLGQFPKGWLEWNDKFRDDVRDFWRASDGSLDRFRRRFIGSPDIFRDGGRGPLASVNFITCHDGFTLTDLVTYEMKHNEDNGEDNRDGHDDNRSWNCGIEGPTIHAPTNALRERQKRNFIVTLLLAQGTPMLLGGDELGRTQRGNNNAYCQDNELSWFDWKPAAHSDWLPFVAFVIRLRRENAAFRRSTWSDNNADGSIAWYDAGGHPLGQEVAAAAPTMPLQVRIASGNDDPDFLLMLNPTNEEVHCTPPAGTWFLLIDTRSPAPHRDDAEGLHGPRGLMPHSAAVLSSKPGVTSSLAPLPDAGDIAG
jgi:isoamylase